MQWLENVDLKAIAIQALTRCHEGQALDLIHFDRHWSEAHRKKSEEDWRTHYLATASRKTGTLMTFIGSCVSQTLQLSEPESELLRQGVEAYGNAFQILDDLKVFCKSLSQEKTYEDLEFPLRNWMLIEYLSVLSMEERLGFFHRLDLQKKSNYEDFLSELFNDGRFCKAICDTLAHGSQQCALAQELLLKAISLHQSGSKAATGTATSTATSTSNTFALAQAQLYLILTKPANELITAMKKELGHLIIDSTQSFELPEGKPHSL